MKISRIALALVAFAAAGTAFAADTEVKGKVDTSVTVGRIIQGGGAVGFKSNNKQTITAGSVQDAKVNGNFKSNVKAGDIIQGGGAAGAMTDNKQEITLGSVKGK